MRKPIGESVDEELARTPSHVHLFAPHHRVETFVRCLTCGTPQLTSRDWEMTVVHQFWLRLFPGVDFAASLIGR